MQVVPVELIGGDFFVRRGGTSVRLLAMNGGPLPLMGGWSPFRVLLGPKRVSVLQLRHETGGLSTWFLNRDLRYETNTFEGLTDRAQRDLMDTIPEFPEIRWDEIAASGVALSDLDSLNPISSITLSGVQIFNTPLSAELSAYADFWKKNDYLIVRNALTEEAKSLLNMKITFEDLKATDDPRQFYRVHNDDGCRKFIRDFLVEARDYYEAILATDVLPTYGFAMKYVRNSDMDPHYDNFDNPVSSTVCYSFSPDGATNPLLLDRARFSNPFTSRVTVADRAGIPEVNVVRIDLEPGDLAVFRGRQHLHWREPIFDDMDYRALLLHFSDVKYKGQLRIAKPGPHVPHQFIDLDNYEQFRETYALYFEQNQEDWV
jgi:hypothetical protein